MTKYILVAGLIAVGAVAGGAAQSTQPSVAVPIQQPAPGSAQPAPPGAGQTTVPATGCPEMATALTALMRADMRLADWPNLARYREANRTLPAPASGESRVVFMGDSITDALAAAALRRVLPRQALRRSRDQRPDDAADAAAVPPRRHRPQAEGGRHPCGHQRHRRQHRADDERGHPGEPGVDERARARATRSASCSRASRR